MSLVAFWRKPNAWVDKRWHAFYKNAHGSGYYSLCEDIYVAHRASSDRKSMPDNGRCGRCMKEASSKPD